MDTQEKDRSNRDEMDRKKKKKKKHRDQTNHKDPAEGEEKKHKHKDPSGGEEKKHKHKDQGEEQKKHKHKDPSGGEEKKHKHKDQGEEQKKHKHREHKESKEDREESPKKEKKEKHKKGLLGKKKHGHEERHCPSCKHKVSSDASQCPECGKPIKSRKKKGNPLLIPLVGFTVLILVCGLSFWYFINKSSQKAILIHQKQLRVTIVNTLKSLYEAESHFATKGIKNKGDYATFQELAVSGLFSDFVVDEKDENKAVFKGYTFRVKVTIGKAPRKGETGVWVERAFSITATPTSDEVGTYSFYMDQKAKITYTDDGSTPTIKSPAWKGESED